MLIGRRWRSGALVVLTVAVLGGAACAGPPPQVDHVATDPGDPFPVTVTHALGQTVIDAVPQRVVTIGATDADTALALDVVPVGIRSQYSFERGVGPWATEALGQATPTVLGREFDVESIAALDPDLILAVQDSGDPEQHELLTRIAPTVSLPVGAEPYGATWQDSTRLIAQALGRAEQGEALVARTEGELAGLAAHHPEFAGRTATYLDVFGTQVYFGGPQSAAVSLLGDLGFVSPPSVSEFPDVGTQNALSLELLPRIEADAVLVYTFERTIGEVTAQVPALSELPAVREDRVYVLTDTALSQPSVLSIPHALEDLVPFLVDAVGR